MSYQSKDHSGSSPYLTSYSLNSTSYPEPKFPYQGEPLPATRWEMPLSNMSFEGPEFPMTLLSPGLDWFGPIHENRLAASGNHYAAINSQAASIEYPATTASWSNIPITVGNSSKSQPIHGKTFNNSMTASWQQEPYQPFEVPFFDPNISHYSFPTQGTPQTLPTLSEDEFSMSGVSIDLDSNYSGPCLADTSLTSPRSSSYPEKSRHTKHQLSAQEYQRCEEKRAKNKVKTLPGKPVYPPVPTKRCDFEGCEKIFVRQEHLKRHQKTHFSSDSFVCPLCDKPFSRLDNLMAHVNLHDKRDPGKPSRRTKYFPEAAEIIKNIGQTRRKGKFSK